MLLHNNNNNNKFYSPSIDHNRLLQDMYKISINTIIVVLVGQWAAESSSHATQDNVEQDKCEHLMERVYKHDVIVPDPPHIIGEWVSRR
jgi:hypothetical protein